MFTDRDDIDADIVRKSYIPMVFRNSRYDLARSQFPFFPHIAVFDPQISIVGGKRYLCDGILNENSRIRFYFTVHDFPLVAYLILDGQSGRYQFVACAVMIKFSTGQWQDCYR